MPKIFCTSVASISATRERADDEFEPEVYESLTTSAVQVKWRTPTTFPCCPAETGPNALWAYAENLTFGSVFSENQYGQSLVVDTSCSGGQLLVLTRATDNVKDRAVAHVFIDGEFFCHKSEGTFFTLAGAVKEFADLSGEEHDIGETFDDYC